MSVQKDCTDRERKPQRQRLLKVARSPHAVLRFGTVDLPALAVKTTSVFLSLSQERAHFVAGQLLFVFTASARGGRYHWKTWNASSGSR